MTANESAQTQPKFELGITGIIQNVFQGNQTTKEKIEKLLGKINFRDFGIRCLMNTETYSTQTTMFIDQRQLKLNIIIGLNKLSHRTQTQKKLETWHRALEEPELTKSLKNIFNTSPPHPPPLIIK